MQETFKPSNCNNLAVEDVITPLPNPDITPPVIKMNFGFLPFMLLGDDCTFDFG